jgi:SpoVK/Ycf46/Vps4 family AAA+-type ATPase
MNELNINKMLNREEDVLRIKQFLRSYEDNKANILIKKGIYVYGDPGTGKTTFITDILNELNYDIIKYDAGDIRNKSIIDTITKHNMSDTNIMSLFNKKPQKIVIIMDEIDGMNSGDKGGINALIKVIRPKKTKKQRLEDISLNPIICIGNYHVDKKIKELIKVCNVVELKKPTPLQVSHIVDKLLPCVSPVLKENIIRYIQGDLRKIKTLYQIYKNNTDTLNANIIQNIFQLKSYNDDTRQIVQKMINAPYTISDHLTVMSETDRTIIGLLWHENIIDVLGKLKKSESIPFYIDSLDSICFADYIDRITFQNQIWVFNEMSSLIKTFATNKKYHDTIAKKKKYNPSEVRFTKVLTKYSTEYNNAIFIQTLALQLGMDKKDIFSFFMNLKSKHSDADIIALLEPQEITKLDINRIYRYIEKYTNYSTDDKDAECLSDGED